MINGDTDVKVYLLLEYLAAEDHPVIVLSVCRDQHDGTTCRQPPIVIFSNSSFPSTDVEHATAYAELWSCLPSHIRRAKLTGATSDRESWAGGSLLVLEGRSVRQSHLSSYTSTPPPDKPTVLLLPTPSDPTPFPNGAGSDLTSASPACLEHNELFLGRPWSSSPLGPISGWTPQLRGLVQTMMAAPFPVLISFGPEYVLLYNEPYSKVIGTKHPRILGMKYDEAWPEVWPALEPVVKNGYQGAVLNVECQEMFLKRGARLEETYFSYSIIPIRESNNIPCGLYIPNFDNTVRIVTERRIRSLHEISQRMTRSLTQESVVLDALDGMKKSNSRDMNFALFYIAEGADKDTGYGGSNGTGRSAVDDTERRSVGGSRGSARIGLGRYTPSQRSDSMQSSGGGSTGLNFRLVGSYGVDNGYASEDIPSEFWSVSEEDTTESSVHPITRLVRRARKKDHAVFVSDLAEIPTLVPFLNGNPFDDPPGSAIILPIRSSAEDRLHGVMVLGLNTRLTWDKEYSNYVQLVKGLLATGLATIKLHKEDLSRARYMAALNRQKNEELQSLLAHRTMELRNSELKFSSAFAGCPAAIWIGSPDGHIWDMNQAYFRMSGHSPDLPLDDWIKRIHPDDMEDITNIFNVCKTERVRAEFRFIPTEQDIAAGVTEKWVEASGGPVRDENGQIVMLSGAIMDITLRKQHLMNQTRRADEALELKQLQDHFIDMLSHELRNPLSAICLSSDGVVDSLQSLAPRCSNEMAEELRDIVNDAGVIKLCTVHMRRLVDDVLALSKLDNNILVITPTPTHAESMCKEVLEIVQSEMLSHDIVCKFQLKQGYRDLGVKWTEMDPSRVKQVLINLLANAIKFTAESDSRTITLTLDASRSRPQLPGNSLNDVPGQVGTEDVAQEDVVNLVFEVSDTGVGMTDEEVQRLFQRFAQGSNRTHLTYGGNGLGLFICRRITQLIGGEISVHSTVGEGSTFTFFIPVPLALPPPTLETAPSAVEDLEMREAESETEISPTSPTSFKGLASWPRPQLKHAETNDIRILLVEDNLISQKLLKKQLVRAGCFVATANDGVEAVDFMVNNVAKSAEASAESSGRRMRVDVILMDMEMPRKGGIEATQDIRAIEADGTIPYRTPIIAVSANARSGQIQIMLDAGMNAAVSKPFQMVELLSQIEALTGKRPGRARGAAI